MKKDRRTWFKRAPLALILLFITWISSGFIFGNLGRVSIIIDGCECGLKREYIQFEHVPLKVVQRAKLDMIIIAAGNENHSHQFWDPQYKEILGLYAYINYRKTSNNSL